MGGPRADGTTQHSEQPHPTPNTTAHRSHQAALPAASSSGGLEGGGAGREERGHSAHPHPAPLCPTVDTTSPKPPGPQLGGSGFSTPWWGWRVPQGNPQEPQAFKTPDLTRTGSVCHTLALGHTPLQPPQGSHQNASAHGGVQGPADTPRPHQLGEARLGCPPTGLVPATSLARPQGPHRRSSGVQPTRFTFFFSLILRELICRPLRTWRGLFLMSAQISREPPREGITTHSCSRSIATVAVLVCVPPGPRGPWLTGSMQTRSRPSQ